MTPTEINPIHSRNFNTLSPADQSKICTSKIAVAGLGGLGGGVCELLARLGIGSLTVIDSDRFEPSNLNRQLLCTHPQIGTSKVQSAEERLLDINPDIRVTPVKEKLDESNCSQLIKGVDVIMDCLDSIPSRFILQKYAAAQNTPIVSGAVAGVTAQISVIYPGDKGYASIYGDNAGQKKEKGVEEKSGTLGYCALMAASLQVSECTKILLDRGEILRNKLFIAHLWDNTFEIVNL